MSLHHYWERIKTAWHPQGNSEEIAFDESGNPVRFPLVRKMLLSLVIILVATLSFGLGKLSNLNQQNEIKIEYADLDNSQLKIENSKTENSEGTSVTASSQGTKYYYSWCGNNISDKNRISFATALMAEKAGYTLAANCKSR